MQLIAPSADRLGLFIEAMERSVDEGSLETWYAKEQIRIAREEPDLFISQSDDMEGIGVVRLEGGIEVPRLPGFNRWMWDGEIAGTINFRWVTGTTELPPTCLGHIGYEVFSWKRRRGYATEALRQTLDLVRPLGMPYVELTTNPENVASQKVILNNGGEFVAEFTKAPENGGGPGYLYRIFF